MIRFATVNDIEAIMTFIDTNWRKGHIMSRDRKLFEFQHLWTDEEVSFVLGEENSELKGILGFIPYDKENRDITLAIWKTIKSQDTMLGVSMLRFLRENGRVHSIAVPGINAKTMSIYNFLGYHTGEMRHWYRLNPCIKPAIAQINDSEIPKALTEKTPLIKNLQDFSASKADWEACLHRDKQLYKSLDFVRRRYYEHPYYEYIKYGLVLDSEELILVFRIQSCNGSNALRLVDCIGDKKIFQFTTSLIDLLIQDLNCEYVDCYETGMSAEYFNLAGWKDVMETNNIIPEYFSPFEQKNVHIYYMAEIEGTCIFKGDGDMDRPN